MFKIEEWFIHKSLRIILNDIFIELKLIWKSLDRQRLTLTLSKTTTMVYYPFSGIVL